jgi:CheY-like chemotaxis protein
MSPATAGKKHAPLEGVRILVADDDRDVVTTLAQLFRREGCEVETAENGLEALSILAERGPFDLVLTDLQMPTPTGLQLVAMARTAGYLGPFIMITAYASEPLREQLERMEDAWLVGKPFDSDELLELARQALALSDPRS